MSKSASQSMSAARPPAAPTPRSTSADLAKTSEYSIIGLSRGVDQAIIRERRRGFTLMVFAIATVIAALYTVEQYLYSRVVGEPVALARLVPAQLLFTYTWALLTPPVMYGAKRFPVWGDGRRINWLIQFGAMVGFVVVHVTLFCIATVAIDHQLSLSDLPGTIGRALLAWSVFDAIVFCALLTVHHAAVYYRVSKDRTVRASQLEARLAQAQLQMLRMQLQPHFLFNTLHSISALMHKDVRRADSMIAALSDLLRMSLQNIGAQEVPLQSELDFLQRYVEIMQLRFGDRLNVTMDVDPEVRDARVPNLFLQPLVENSFRHGFGDLGQGSIAISVRREADMLHCEVVDNGRGLRPGHKEGVGFSSARQRLTHLYGDRHTFSVHGAPGEGVRVSMAIPFNPSQRMAAD
jgi:two-component system, LytTR family, sensor kinase